MLIINYIFFFFRIIWHTSSNFQTVITWLLFRQRNTPILFKIAYVICKAAMKSQIHSTIDSIKIIPLKLRKKSSRLNWGEDKRFYRQQELTGLLSHTVLQDSLYWKGICWHSQVKYGMHAKCGKADRKRKKHVLQVSASNVSGFSNHGQFLLCPNLTNPSIKGQHFLL